MINIRASLVAQLIKNPPAIQEMLKRYSVSSDNLVPANMDEMGA